MRQESEDQTPSTAAGIELKPYYTHEDWSCGNAEQMEAPGEYPFTRGLHASAYNETPWMMQQVHGAGTAEHTREIMDRLAAEGMEGYFGHKVYNVVLDNPSKGGLDPDHPEARGYVGIGGLSLSHLDDMERLIEGLPLDQINLSLITGDTCLIGLAMYVVAAERRGYKPEQLRGNSMNWLLKSFCVDNPTFPPRAAQRLSAELIAYASSHMPLWNTTNFSGYLIREAGANAVQELAFSLAWGESLIQECVDRGLAIDDFARRLGFQISFHSDFFEEIAKLRALRRMWARLVHEKYGAKHPKSGWARVHIHTAGDTLLFQQPMNNIPRVAIQVLGAVLAGVQSIHACAYTESVEVPTADQARLALRTQQIILHETNVAAVADPLGGSWYVEHLTDEMERKAQEVLDEIDAQGGFTRAAETGWVKGQLVAGLIDNYSRIERGELIKVGLNKYQTEEAPESRPARFALPDEVEETAIRRLQEHKARRDGVAVERALDEVRAALDRNEALMPPVLDAVRVGATHGELMDVMKAGLGWAFVTG